MLKRRIQVNGARALVLGLTFKETCPDLRNCGAVVDVHDPCANADNAKAASSLDLVTEPEEGAYDGIILAVAHDAYRTAGAANLRGFSTAHHLFCDIKGVFAKCESDLRL